MMTTKSPPSTWGAKVVLCLPRRRIAVWLARRPSTTSVASMTCHRHSTSCGLGVYVRTDKPSFSRGCETGGSDVVNVVVRLWWCTSSHDLSPDDPSCLLYTSDAADDLTRVDLGGRCIIKKKKQN